MMINKMNLYEKYYLSIGGGGGSKLCNKEGDGVRAEQYTI